MKLLRVLCSPYFWADSARNTFVNAFSYGFGTSVRIMKETEQASFGYVVFK
jgi:hypothetical protein